MKVDLKDIALWGVLPFLNFVVWVYIGKTHVQKSCDNLNILLVEARQQLKAEEACEAKRADQCSPSVRAAMHKHFLEFVNTEMFDKYRTERLATMTGKIFMTDEYPERVETAVLRLNKDVPCSTTDHMFMSIKDDMCIAVVHVGHSNHSYNVVRINQDIDINGLSISVPNPEQIDRYSAGEQGITLNVHNEGKMHPGGYFRKVPKDRGRDRLKEKLYPLLSNWKDIQKLLQLKLEGMDIHEGGDVVVMAVNEGEIDLFLNFACSCKLHNINLKNVLVFVGGGRFVTHSRVML
jgi:hypothetical protein